MNINKQIGHFVAGMSSKKLSNSLIFIWLVFLWLEYFVIMQEDVQLLKSLIQADEDLLFMNITIKFNLEILSTPLPTEVSLHRFCKHSFVNHSINKLIFVDS